MKTANPAESADNYLALRTLAKQAENVERVVLAIENQVRAFTADGWPPIAFAWSDTQVPALRQIRKGLMKQVEALGSQGVLGEWVRTTKGLGPNVYYVTGLIPPLADFKSPAAVWKYMGLHVSDGAAVRRKAGEFAGFNVRLRAYALKRIGDPCIKVPGAPYREVYDLRRARTDLTHPPMLGQGEGCPICDESYEKTADHRSARNLERERPSAPAWSPATTWSVCCRSWRGAFLRRCTLAYPTGCGR